MKMNQEKKEGDSFTLTMRIGGRRWLKKKEIKRVLDKSRYEKI